MLILISSAFAQSLEPEALKSKVETLEKELQEIKVMLRQQSEKDVQKEKGNGLIERKRYKKGNKSRCRRSTFTAANGKSIWFKKESIAIWRGILFG